MGNTELVLLVFRIVVLVLLYLFVARLALALWRDVRRAQRRAPAAHPSASGPGVLYVAEPAGTGLGRDHVVPLQARTSIGRGPGNALALDDDAVSNEHAVVTWRNDDWWIQDLGSTNGTLLNGRRITAVTKLQSGDVVQIGRVKLRFEA